MCHKATKADAVFEPSSTLLSDLKPAHFESCWRDETLLKGVSFPLSSIIERLGLFLPYVIGSASIGDWTYGTFQDRTAFVVLFGRLSHQAFPRGETRGVLPFSSLMALSKALTHLFVRFFLLGVQTSTQGT